MLSQNELQAELESVLSPIGSSRQSFSPRGAGLRFQGRIIDWIEKKLAEGLITPEAKERLKQVALTVYDGFDVPYISGKVEEAVKRALRPAFEAIIDSLLRIDAA